MRAASRYFVLRIDSLLGALPQGIDRYGAGRLPLSPTAIVAVRPRPDTRQVGQAQEGRQRMHDDRRRDAGEIARHASLGLEALAEGRAAQKIGEARRYAARDEHAAARPQRRGDIAGDAAQEGAEQLERLAAHLATVGQRVGPNLAPVAPPPTLR